MDATLEQLQALRLLRAFSEIRDFRTREALIAYAEQARKAENEIAGRPPDQDAP